MPFILSLDRNLRASCKLLLQNDFILIKKFAYLYAWQNFFSSFEKAEL